MSLIAHALIDAGSSPVRHVLLLAVFAGLLVLPVATDAQVGQADAASKDGRGRRMVLLFDISALTPDLVRQARDVALQFVDENTSSSGTVAAVVTIGSKLSVLTDFSSSREQLRAALDSPGLLDGTATDVGTLGTTPTKEAAPEAFKDVRLRALATVCDTLGPVQQRTAVLFFTGGMNGAAGNDQTELRSATNTCNRGNVTVYPVDARGLQAAAAPGNRSIFPGARE